jgi:hypothetical protein
MRRNRNRDGWRFVEPYFRVRIAGSPDHLSPVRGTQMHSKEIGRIRPESPRMKNDLATLMLKINGFVEPEQR